MAIRAALRTRLSQPQLRLKLPDPLGLHVDDALQIGARLVGVPCTS
jgi:hypothetical protein